MPHVDEARDKSRDTPDDDLSNPPAIEVHPTLTPSGSGASGDTSRSGAAEGTGTEAEDPLEGSSVPCRAARKHHKPRQQQQQKQRRHHQCLHHQLPGRGSTDDNHYSDRGMLFQAIPVMPLWLAVTCCCLNILVPGSGTLVSAFSLLCGLSRPNRRHARPASLFLLNVITSLLQLLTFVLIVGWIWSIIWGMTFVQLAVAVASSSGRGSVERSSVVVPYYVRRHSSVS